MAGTPTDRGATTYIGYDTNGDWGDGDPGLDTFIRMKNCKAVQTTQVRIAPAPITGITQANPCVVTAPAHGVAQWDFVTFSDIGGMTALNGRTLIASAVTTDTITLQTVDLDTGVRSNLNSTGFGAYTSGGFVKLADFMDHPTSGNTIGFYFHTDGQLKFRNVDLEGCESYGCAMPFNAANTELFTLTDVSARQFYIGVGALADKTVFRGQPGTVSFLNRPAMVGATLLRTDLANQTIEMDGISATLNSTGNIFLTQAGVKVTFRRGTLRGFHTLFRCLAAGQVLDVREMTHVPNGLANSAYKNFNINATAAANIQLVSNFNDFGASGGSLHTFDFGASTGLTLDQWRALTGQDWLSKA